MPDAGVPKAPSFTTKEPVVPTLTASEEATPVPRPVSEDTAGVMVTFEAAVSLPVAPTVKVATCVELP